MLLSEVLVRLAFPPIADGEAEATMMKGMTGRWATSIGASMGTIAMPWKAHSSSTTYVSPAPM
jgi:hypothetical protein